MSEPGLYFVEFNAAVADRLLIGKFAWNRIAKAPPEPSWPVAKGWTNDLCRGRRAGKAKPRRTSPGLLGTERALTR